MLSNNTLINNYSLYSPYMASTAGFIGEFSGTVDENATIWFEQASKLLLSFNFPEDYIVRAIVLAFRKEAKMWFFQTGLNINDLNLKNLKNFLTCVLPLIILIQRIKKIFQLQNSKQFKRVHGTYEFRKSNLFKWQFEKEIFI